MAQDYILMIEQLVSMCGVRAFYQLHRPLIEV